VISEGVETNEQLKLLHQQGCDEIQGFFFSQPLSVADMEKLLNTKTHPDNWLQN
jgi:EAL domain-containing protein (putative c-di-GMP-specific phosphodiesterase class I)